MLIRTQNRSESGRCARFALCPHPTHTDTEGAVATVPGGTEENHRTSISIAGIWAEN
jgi:hypothetical protein